MELNMSEYQEFIDYIKDFHKRGGDIVEKKNADYAGTENPLRNFIDASTIAEVTVEQGLLVRMADKLARVRTLTSRHDSIGEVGEKLEDTLMDLANYAAILAYVCKVSYVEEQVEPDKEKELIEEETFTKYEKIKEEDNKTWYEKLLS